MPIPPPINCTPRCYRPHLWGAGRLACLLRVAPSALILARSRRRNLLTRLLIQNKRCPYLLLILGTGVGHGVSCVQSIQIPGHKEAQVIQFLDELDKVTAKKESFLVDAPQNLASLWSKIPFNKLSQYICLASSLHWTFTVHFWQLY